MLYLTISTEHVPILTPKLVHHLYNMSNTRMMQPEPAVLAPRIGLGHKGSGLSQTGHHAQQPPNACLALHHRVEVADSHINGIHWNLVLHEAPVDIHNYFEGDGSLTNPAIARKLEVCTVIYWYRHNM